ncbi:uncharacterized protein LOC144363589 [Saccoglossus kowalevskii]
MKSAPNLGFRHKDVEYHTTRWGKDNVTFAAVVYTVAVPKGQSITNVINSLGPSVIEGDDIPTGGFEFIPFNKYTVMTTNTIQGLHESAAFGKTEVVDYILSSSEPVPITSLTDRRYSTPLHYAASNGHLQTVKKLLEFSFGSDILNMQDINGKTALHLALYRKQYSTISYLLKHDVAINDHDDANGYTPLHLLKQLPIEFWETCLPQLIKIPDELAKHLSVLLAGNGRLDLLSNIVDDKLLVQLANTPNLLQRTLIHECAENNDISSLQVLFSKPGVKWFMEDGSGNTPLSIACRKENMDIIELILSHDSMKSYHTLRPLFEALKKKSAEVIIRLLRQFKDISFDKDLRAIFVNELEKLNTDKKLRILSECQDKIIMQRFLSWAVYTGKLELVKTFTEKGTNTSLADYMGRTPLHEACQAGDFETVQYLLESGNVNPNVPDLRGSTPFHYACGNGNKDIVQYFLQKDNVRADIQDCNGRTPLLVALYKKHTEMAFMMIEKYIDKVNISAEDILGFTALHFTFLYNTDIHSYVSRITQSLRSLETQSNTINDWSVPLLSSSDYDLVNDTWGAHLGSVEMSKRVKKKSKHKTAFQLNRRQSLRCFETPLSLAVTSENVEAIKVLAVSEEVLIQTDNFSRTQLEVAIDGKRTKSVTALIESYRTLGINLPEMSDIQQYNLEDIIKTKGEYDEDHPQLGPAIFRVCKDGEIEEVKRLINRGDDLSVKFEGRTTLEVALENGHCDVSLEILQWCVREKNFLDVFGSIVKFALIAAVLNQWKVVKEMLKMSEFSSLEHEEKLVTDAHGQSLIHHIARHGEVELLLMIVDVELGSKLDRLDRSNRTPLWYAVAYQNWDMAKTLLLHNSNPLKSRSSMIPFIYHKRVVTKLERQHEEYFMYPQHRHTRSWYNQFTTQKWYMKQTRSNKSLMLQETIMNRWSSDAVKECMSEEVTPTSNNGEATVLIYRLLHGTYDSSAVMETVFQRHDKLGSLLQGVSGRKSNEKKEENNEVRKTSQVSQNIQEEINPVTWKQQSETKEHLKKRKEIQYLFNLAIFASAQQRQATILHMVIQDNNLDFHKEIFAHSKQYLDAPDLAFLLGSYGFAEWHMQSALHLEIQPTHQFDFRRILYGAVSIGRNVIVDLILTNHTADAREMLINYRKNVEFSILATAVIHSQLESVEKLLQYGTKVAGIHGPLGLNIMHCAVMFCRNKVIFELLNNKISMEDRQSPDCGNMSPADYACALGRSHLLPYLTDMSTAEDCVDKNDHYSYHMDNEDATCFHCLRIRSFGWFHKFITHQSATEYARTSTEKIQKSDILHITDMYRWILKKPLNSTSIQMIETIFFNSASTLEGTRLKGSSIASFLKAICHYPSNPALVSLETVLSQSDITGRCEIVLLFISMTGIYRQELLHTAVILKLPYTSETLYQLCYNDSECAGYSIEETAKAFGFPLNEIQKYSSVSEQNITSTLL